MYIILPSNKVVQLANINHIKKLVMKKIINLLVFSFLISNLLGQIMVDHKGISKTSLNLTTVQVLEQITMDVPSSGKVIVRFDGSCISSPGDRIVLAASNSPSWGTNNGSIGVEAFDSDINGNSFSHTRVYNVTQGSYTYYAVAQNYVETGGTGIASIYGSLTVKFIPSSNAIIESKPLIKTNIDLNTLTVLESVTINPTVSGKVVVRFDGDCYADIGDRIILAASNTANWSPNGGNVGVEVYDNDLNHAPFAHSRIYDVTPGSYTYYAVGQNYLERDGDGIASIYGNFTVEFIPNSDAEINWQTVAKTEDLTTLKVLAQSNHNFPEEGTVIVRFDGSCIASPGDRIILAASNNAAWTANDGNVGIEIIDSDLNRAAFSHTRAYPVSAGVHSFYGVGQNYVETGGTGTASVYGLLSVEFYPKPVSGVVNIIQDIGVEVFPNPTLGSLQIDYPDDYNPNGKYIQVTDPYGRILSITESGLSVSTIDISNYENGIYFLQIIDVKEGILLASKKVVKL